MIKERSILDNISTFGGAIVVARRGKQGLVILLLDFEKAYDPIDWEFFVAKMGFSQKWIKGVSSLCSCATSKVMIAGGKGPSYNITRSVC